MDTSAHATSGPLDRIALALAAYVKPEGSPFVLVTYAQSADAALTATRGKSTAISCPETMKMTHSLRTMFEAILVGVATVIGDNPSLTARLVSGRNPQPVVLDPELAIPLECKLLSTPSCTRPIVLTRQEGSLTGPAVQAARASRRAQLTAAGARILEVPSLPGHPRGHLDLRAAMIALRREYDIRSVMVEGGAGVLGSFLEQHGHGGGAQTSETSGPGQPTTAAEAHEAAGASPAAVGAGASLDQSPLIHGVLITIAPMLMPGGLHIPGPASSVQGSSTEADPTRGPHHMPAPVAPILRLQDVSWHQVGSDMGLCGTLPQ